MIKSMFTNLNPLILRFRLVFFFFSKNENNNDRTHILILYVERLLQSYNSPVRTARRLQYNTCSVSTKIENETVRTAEEPADRSILSGVILKRPTVCTRKYKFTNTLTPAAATLTHTIGNDPLPGAIEVN